MRTPSRPRSLLFDILFFPIGCLIQTPPLILLILVTSGDFANPEIVRTDVYEHHFTWTSPKTSHPQGTINLLHTVPLNEDIYQQLLQVKNGEQVTISGPEILRIDAYQPDGKMIAWWRDSGCNSMVVTTVQIQSNP